MIQLLHYVHCPYCVRVRMSLGFLGLPWESVVLPYDDEETPLSLTGKKMLPILRTPERVMNESLDIIAFLDHKNKLNRERFYQRKEFYEKLLEEISTPLHNLAMPYWIWTPEFSDSSRQYFRAKKEKKRGPFEQLIQTQAQDMKRLSDVLAKYETSLKPFFDSDRFSLVDIVIASHLWGGYIVPEWQFSPAWHQYLQRVKALCHFDYHRDFWQQNLHTTEGVTT